MKLRMIVLSLSLLLSVKVFCQESSLKSCMEIAKNNNVALKLAEQSLETRQKLLQASKNNGLPKIDLLAGYNYIGEPLRVNLQQVKDGVVEGTAGQNVSSANTVYQQVTGNQLPQQIQDIIYQTSKDIIGAVYPNYNPQISKQSYFLAGLALRQPLYLGGKLKASRQLAQQQVESGKANLASAEELMNYNIALQYIQLLYFNSMIAEQQKMVESLQQNEVYAENLLQAELIAPYQKNWATVAKLQGETNLKNLNLEKDNVLLALKDLMGVSLDHTIAVNGRIDGSIALPAFSSSQSNADIKLLRSKKMEAETGLDIARSFTRPNIFAIGNVQFFRKDLPIITPPWLVGVEMQWTLFDPERKSRNLASQSLVYETDLLIDQKIKTVNLATKVAENKLVSLKDQSDVLSLASKQASITTDMVRRRMENSLSSIKDVNDALQLQYEAKKLFYTAVVAYQTALASYLYICGNTENITKYIP